MCRFCGSVGASLKCNHPDCCIHFHYHCLRSIKLMGLQLDHEEKYIFKNMYTPKGTDSFVRIMYDTITMASRSGS